MPTYVNKLNMALLKEATYSNLYDSAQSTVWNFIRYNSTVNRYTTNVIDKDPIDLNKDFGFPLVVIESPISEEPELTFKQRDTTVTLQINIISLSSNTLRELADAVRKCLYDNQTFIANKCRLSRFRVSDNRFDTRELSDGSFAYEYSMTIKYEWCGYNGA